MKSSSKKKLPVTSQRMLELLDFCVRNKVVLTQKDWCEKIGFNTTNLSQVRSGRQGFTDEQKLAAAQLIGVNMNWIFGLESNMIRMEKTVKPVDLIRQGLRMLEKNDRA
jgi:hypothetical protein